MYEQILLAPSGTTAVVANGNSVHSGAGYEAIGLQFVWESGAGTSVTYKFQGSPDNVNWYDVGYVTDASDTISQATRNRTSAGADIEFLSNPVARKYRYWRVVITAVTGAVVYRAELYRIG